MKKETNFKTEFFKKLTEVCSNFNKSGVKEVKAIALVYQVAFKIIEQNNKLQYPIQYKFTAIDVNKNVLDKYREDVHQAAVLLLNAVEECEAFEDLMTLYIEESGAMNTNLAQYFSPSDIAETVGMLSVFTATVEQFEQVKYVDVGDPTGCGAGSLVLGQLRAMSKIDGFKDHHYQSVSVYMNDLDEDLHRIAFFQVLLSSLLHCKPIGRLETENKNILSEYTKQTDSLLFIANMQRELKVISLKIEKEKDELSTMASVNWRYQSKGWH